MPTIQQVALEAGVSPATVSRSFTNSALLSRETREHVLEVARRMNYSPPHVRRRQRDEAETQKEAGGAIGFQFFAPTDDATILGDAFYAPMMAGAQAEAEKLGLHLLVHTTTRHKMLAELPRMIREQAVRGMLLVGTADAEVLTAFLEHVMQIVLVDNRDLTGRHDCVLSDGAGGARSATEYLFRLNHRRVGYAMSALQTATFQDRLSGYLFAHFQAGIPADPARIVAAASDEEFAAQTRSLLLQPDRPTAILAANDPCAYRLMMVCRELGLKIPEDISIVGFDDDKFSALSYPALTTVHVDTTYMGRLAVQRLQARLRDEQKGVRPEPPVNLEVPVSLVIRASSRALP